jgi:hypothetical protein
LENLITSGFKALEEQMRQQRVEVTSKIDEQKQILKEVKKAAEDGPHAAANKRYLICLTVPGSNNVNDFSLAKPHLKIISDYWKRL